MDKSLVEYYHNTGQMPDRIYNQVNGKSAFENYADMVNKRQVDNKRSQQQQEALEEYITKLIEQRLEECLEKALANVFKDFK